MRIIGLITIAAVCLLLIPLGCVGCWLLSRKASVVDKEFSPEALLKKYEHFKDVAAALDQKRATIKIAESRLRTIDKQYAGVARKEWPRVDAEQYATWQQEAMGLKASYNATAADYNAQMAKENWRFCNAGELPKGASSPLPREFAAYLEE